MPMSLVRVSINRGRDVESVDVEVKIVQGKDDLRAIKCVGRTEKESIILVPQGGEDDRAGQTRSRTLLFSETRREPGPKRESFQSGWAVMRVIRMSIMLIDDGGLWRMPEFAVVDRDRRTDCLTGESAVLVDGGKVWYEVLDKRQVSNPSQVSLMPEQMPSRMTLILKTLNAPERTLITR